MRAIFTLFEEHGSALRALGDGAAAQELDEQDGSVPFGRAVTLNSLRRLLTNILHTGAIRHRG